MNHKILRPRQALNKAYLKVKPVRKDIEVFKTNLINLIDQINESESEEFHKNLVSDFLKRTYYEPDFSINTKGRNDLVIHNGKSAKSNVGVILETKKPTNRGEMVALKEVGSENGKKAYELKANTKAFQELVLYFLRERITLKNLEIRNLIITNIYEWFIFDAITFEKAFAQNKSLVKQFEDFEAGRLSGTNTDFFYKEIAAIAIEKLDTELTLTHFDLRNYEKPLRNDDLKDDTKLIALYKLLSPAHLLKEPFSNDSNSLNKDFYHELLHIIGLEQVGKNKKVIERKSPATRNPGSLLENTINQLKSVYALENLDKPSLYGNTEDERLFNVGLELCITWINRILFLKLLEAQLLSYHKGDKRYAFLNWENLSNYDDLQSLFFEVLARQADDRSSEIPEAFALVPYLNSSLFEPNELEKKTIFISNLRDERMVPLYTRTALGAKNGKRQSGEMNTLEYLFAFLNSYDFSSEGAEDIQEDNKTLINASVLGLIFEKINGYKDGSFFTPGFITMYMARETVRKAVVQKFNEGLEWKCSSFEDLKEDLPEWIVNHQEGRSTGRVKANELVNSIKVCDPAVGSGHFLVSVLNEIITIKHELRILQDSEGKPISGYRVEVENDELIVTDLMAEDEMLFQYNPLDRESARVQKTLFQEKQTIIENCLFGVDINPNSVKICRLRLWIELLKNAYYNESGHLETLPNIDINIKCGNSLISRFPLDVDLKDALKKSKWNIDSYKIAVSTYRNAKSKEEKREMERLIADIKSDFRSEIANNDPKKKRKAKLGGELYNLTSQTGMFEETAKQKMERKKRVEKLEQELNKLSTEIEEIKHNKIYENAFEWRFEFPEVLDGEGNFVGFDVVIGNPPYIGGREWGLDKIEFDYYLQNYRSAEYQFDAFVLFWDLSIRVSKNLVCLITPNAWLNNQKTQKLRENILKWKISEIVDYSKIKVFEDATVLPIITQVTKLEEPSQSLILLPHESNLKILNRKGYLYQHVWVEDPLKIINIDIHPKELEIRTKIENDSVELKSVADVKFGIKIYQTGKGKPKQTPDAAKNKIFESSTKIGNEYLPYLKGKNINKYSFTWDGGYLKYGDNLAEPRYKDLFIGARILVRRIVGESLICSYVNQDLVTGQLLQIVKPEKEEITKALTGILNSKLMGFYFKKKYNRQDVTFPEIRIYELASLPIKIPKDLKLINSLVEKVMYGKEPNNTLNTSDLENQIDELVYELYGLTEEEIAIVEGKSVSQLEELKLESS
ncbi:Eco57I restriction-modification methylase domain-containing protein [Litoribacter ruber]|uniref:DUF7149 domain-containing protein n=1 Tax=Litoribacter ruber TaxID=702568 RepID=UPI001BD9A827|nr:TaqI-like C-terminal specificity domain-containing protein [Litoribacter ruber]MBT0813022.1 Eco57I restriction-modification methylase domain-containing protein [Litoribacter ruber]